MKSKKITAQCKNQSNSIVCTISNQSKDCFFQPFHSPRPNSTTRKIKNKIEFELDTRLGTLASHPGGEETQTGVERVASLAG